MLIKLYDYDYSKETPTTQLLKIIEEINELEQAGDDLDKVAEEGFDLIQALVGYLIVLDIDVGAANVRHLEKLCKRHGGGR